MTVINSKYKIAIFKNGLPYYGEVQLKLEINDSKKLAILENYQGNGFNGQGTVEDVSSIGYDEWKKGVKHGITYAYSKLKNTFGLKVTIEHVKGLSTDTNPIILGFAASRAVLEELENSENLTELKQIEELVTSSWDYEFNSLPNFIDLSIEGKHIINRHQL